MRIYVLIFVTLAMLQVGCNMLQSPATPTALVRDVSVIEQTEQGAKIMAVIVLSNPNTTPLPLVNCQFILTVDGGGSYVGTDEVHRTLPARARQMVPLPAAFAMQPGTDLRAAAYTIDGSISYRRAGQFRRLMTESKIPLPRVQFHAKGHLE